MTVKQRFVDWLARVTSIGVLVGVALTFALMLAVGLVTYLGLSACCQ